MSDAANAANAPPATPQRPPPGAPPPQVPSMGRQKSFIIDNATILNLETKKAILSVVMMEIGPTVVTESGTAKEVNIDLDAVASENEAVLLNIYNMVRARLEVLNLPARGGGR